MRFKWFDLTWLKQWFAGNEHKKPHVGKAPTQKWDYDIPRIGGVFAGLWGSVKAPTKSEACSVIKNSLGFQPRLPIGTVVSRAK